MHPNNQLHLLCHSEQGAGVQAWSADSSNTWGELSKTILLSPDSGTDAVTLQDGSYLVMNDPDVPSED